MFWSMSGLSTVSPVETILDKETFTLEDLLDEDEIIQECKALNTRLINFLREGPQVEKLLRYVVEEAPEDAERRRTFKFPFIACEIFTCEVDIILKALVEDEQMMDLLFSFLDPDRSHSNLLAGYFSKVVICLLLRKTVPFVNYVQAHPEIVQKLVDLIGITSIMEVLIRLIGADDNIYGNYTDSMEWLEYTAVLEIIVDKFSSSDCPEVHANAAETLCAVTRQAPPNLAAKISSASFIERLFRHALEESRPKSVLVNVLSVCISLLDPRRLPLGTYQLYSRQYNQGSTVSVNPQTAEGMLSSIGDLLKLLDFSSDENVLLTTYGKLQPPLGKQRLKIIEFISVLVNASSEASEQELIRLGALKRILDLFFEYPYNNCLHHHVECILVSCFESKNPSFVQHLIHDCNLVEKILEAEKKSTLDADAKMPTVPAEGKTPPRIGNIGHLTRISNKLVLVGNNNSTVQTYLQGNSEWIEWQTTILAIRNTLEDVHQWACGRPTSLHDRRDSDEDDYQDRDYDVATLANNLSQAFRYGMYSNDDTEEGHGSLERDDQDVYFDDESAEVVVSSLRQGEEQEGGSLFTNSNWFAFEDDRTVNESTDSTTSASPNMEGTNIVRGDNVIVKEEEEAAGTVTHKVSDPDLEPKDAKLENISKDLTDVGTSESNKPPEWVEWRETSESAEPSGTGSSILPNGDPQLKEVPMDEVETIHAPTPTTATAAPTVTAASPAPATTELTAPALVTAEVITLAPTTTASTGPAEVTTPVTAEVTAPTTPATTASTAPALVTAEVTTPAPAPAPSPIVASSDGTKTNAKEAPDSTKKPSEISVSGDKNASGDTSLPTVVDKEEVAEPEKKTESGK